MKKRDYDAARIHRMIITGETRDDRFEDLVEAVIAENCDKDWHTYGEIVKMVENVFHEENADFYDPIENELKKLEKSGKIKKKDDPKNRHNYLYKYNG